MKSDKAAAGIRSKSDDLLASFFSESGPTVRCMLLTISEPDWIDRIRKGLPGEAVVTLARRMRIPQKDIAGWLHTTARTLQRYIETQTNLSLEISDRLAQLVRLYCRCEEVFKDEDKVSTWLKTPNYALGGVAPISLLDTIPGIDLVLDELGRIEHGVFI